MDALQKLIETEGGAALLLLLSPTVALGVFAFMWFKTLKPSPPKPVDPVNIETIKHGIVLRHEFESILSAMRKEQRAIAAAIHDISERLARVEAKQEERERRET